MDTLKTKTAKYIHVVFNFVSILCTPTWCRTYSKVPCTYVSMNILLWNGRTFLRNNTRVHPELKMYCLCTNFILAIFKVFRNRQSTRNTFLPNSTTTLSCTRGPNITDFRIYCSAWTVVYMKTSFLSVNR